MGYEKARHPGKTSAQRAVLDQIGCGDCCPPGHPKTFAKLVELGLLHRLQDKVIGRDRFGVIAIPQFEMPVHVHMQWCDAVAYTDDEMAEIEAATRPQQETPLT